MAKQCDLRREYSVVEPINEAERSETVDLTTLIQAAKSKTSDVWENVTALTDQLTESVGDGLGFVKGTLNSSWLFGSRETIESAFDEKHYFLVPYRAVERGYTLYSMRCLPDGVPPINDLPKKRVFHLPNENASQMVETLLRDQAIAETEATDTGSPTAAKLTDLADQIDRLDQQVFHGALLIGGLVALANPVAGGILAAKALVSSLGMLLAKYGLRTAGDSLDEKNLESRIRTAEKNVLTEFRGKDTSMVVSSLLSQLDKAIRTDAFDYDPIVDGPIFDQPHNDITTQEFRLAATAIVNTYADAMDSPAVADAAHVGSEDLRWLQLLRATLQSDSQ